MAITLAKLCKDTERKYNMKLVSGKGGMDNMVRWVHMVEEREAPEFLHGNELILTTGICHTNSERLLEFVAKLKKSNAVGIVLNLGPYISDVTEDLISYCEKENFPLFTLPWDVYIIDVTYDFCRRIIENEKSEMSAVEAFKNLIACPENRDGYVQTLEWQGFKMMNRYKVAVLQFTQNGKPVTEQFYKNNHMKLCTILAKSTYPSAMFTYDEMLVVIRQNSPDSMTDQIAQRLDKSIERLSVSYSIGISDMERGYMSVPQLFKEAKAAYLTAVLMGKKLMYYRCIGINKLVFGVENKEILRKYVSEYITKIYNYDNENRTDYAKTLRQYLECNGSIKSVADANGIHRNTVNGKMKQIRELFDLELTGEQKTEIMLAFHIKDVLEYI